MARLNEAAAPTESIDALKRRFVRQNREIARANSTQSLRIRALESETSALLAENLALREQIIKLEAEVDKNTSRHVLEDVDGIQGRLEEKLGEIGSLVAQLGGLKDARRPRKVSPKTSRRRSSNGRDWKNAFRLSAEEGRLPPITEDKYYPRRTLSTDELRGLLSQSVDAAGTPAPPLDGDVLNAGPAEEDIEAPEVHPALPANLETRRRRRDSTNPSGQKRQEVAKAAGAPSDRPLRAGAKRKLDAREEGDKVEGVPSDIEEFEQFIFRKSADGAGEVGVKAPAERKEGRGTTRETKDLAVARGITQARSSGPTPAAPSDRRALGPKDTNCDPSSPGKKSRTGARETGATLQEPTKDRVRDRKPAADKPGRSRFVAKAPPEHVEAVEIVPEPETPAPSDMFSPISSEPSAPRPDSRDTPPPSELHPSTSTGDDVGAVAGRAARRPRGSVNYAEPNLRDKMRRPTKVLVDAVTGEGKSQRKSSVRLEGGRSESDDADGKSMRTVVIKKEDGSESSTWKRLPRPGADGYDAEEGSPLTNKTSAGQDLEAASQVSQRRRRASGLQRDDGPDGLKAASASAAAISALVANSKKSREQRQQQRRDNTLQPAAEDELDIYDFDGASPTIRGGAGDALKAQRHRRAPSAAAPDDAGDEASDADAASAAARRAARKSRGGRRQTLGRDDFELVVETARDGDAEQVGEGEGEGERGREGRRRSGMV
ncbi:MAG: hypothetical protein M1832_003990 [Thelocarpon impressellum]|nr:MAG: hypothetical protein M1832_003990 [Thelocarpon impressellum]